MNVDTWIQHNMWMDETISKIVVTYMVALSTQQWEPNWSIRVPIVRPATMSVEECLNYLRPELKKIEDSDLASQELRFCTGENGEAPGFYLFPKVS